MTDTAFFYGEELLIQSLGGLAIGGAINYVMPHYVGHTTHSNVAQHLIELAIQLGLSAAGATMFVSWMMNRGWDPRQTPLGTAPFWIMLFKQGKLEQKIKGITMYGVDLIDTLATDMVHGKGNSDLKKITPQKASAVAADCDCKH